MKRFRKNLILAGIYFFILSLISPVFSQVPTPVTTRVALVKLMKGVYERKYSVYEGNPYYFTVWKRYTGETEEAYDAQEVDPPEGWLSGLQSDGRPYPL